MIHQSADVQTAEIGSGTRVWQFCVILPRARIGSNCNINSHVFIENDVVIGDNVTIKCGVQIWDGVTLEDRVMVGPNVTFTNDLVPRSQPDTWILSRTLVKYGASLGANATILCGTTIGRFALVGAGAVVTHDIPDNTVWYGNPARQHGFVTPAGVLLDMECRDQNGTRRTLEEMK